MAKDNKGAYDQVPNPANSSTLDMEDDFEIEDEDNVTSTTATFPQELDIEEINNFKHSFPGTPGTPRGPFGRVYKLLGGKRKKVVISVGAFVIAILILSLFVRFQDDVDKPEYKDPESTTPESAPVSSSTVDVPARPPPIASTPDTSQGDRLSITMNDFRQGLFSVNSKRLKFINPEFPSSDENDEGLYYHYDDVTKEIKAAKFTDLTYSNTLTTSLSFEYSGKEYNIVSMVPNLKMTHSILATDRVSEFRHSYTAHHWIFEHSSGNIYPILLENEELAKTSFASWSPQYNYISFVKDNNLYVKDLSSLENTQVTFDGSDRVYYARPDWVYEEEVFATYKALWWAPDETKVVFLKLDDSNVEQYELQYYAKTGPGESGYNKYPESKKINYPKPGSANPHASLHVYTIASDEVHELDRSDSQLGDDFIVYGAFFIDDSTIVIKETDRVSNILEFRRYDINTKKTSVFHKINSGEEYKGWIEKQAQVVIIPKVKDGKVSNGFVDVQVVDGYNHLVYFASTDEGPISLTSGNWEVDKSALGYNPKTNEVYYFSNEGSSMDQHLYGVNLDTKETTLKVKEADDSEKGGYYTGSFSAQAKYVVLSYEGPDVPYSMVYNLETNSQELYLTTDKDTITENLQKYKTPTKKLHKIKVEDNVELNVVESKPYNFDPSKKYPLLVHHYGGPGSQVVFNKFEMGFEETVCSTLDAVVLYIEPRGTGGQGWAFRSWAKRKIGYWEPRDIKAVTEKWVDSQDSFIDKEKVAIWGWSYGGFTTLNTLQYDGGDIFKYGIAVAPVTDWRLYDSIYTERYMDKPEDNLDGYEISQIYEFDNLKKVNRFLVMHGSADDNVHLQNTMILMDEFDLNGVKNYEMKVFPDSDHSISFHNANPIIFDKIFNWLKDAFDGQLSQLQSKRSEA